MPRNDDAEVARAALAFSRKHDAGAFALTYLELWAPAIRAVLGQLSKRKTALFTFLVSLVDPRQRDTTVELSWRRALRPLSSIHPAESVWGGTGDDGVAKRRKLGPAVLLKKRRAAMLKVAGVPSLLDAFRAAVVSDLKAPWAFIEVLAVDGSEESIDSLLPIFHRASRDRELPLLDRFCHLRQIARATPAMNALLGAAEKAREENQERTTSRRRASASP